MTIGTLTATLGIDSQGAINSMTHFERVMITLVNKIDSTLERMEASMAGVTGAAIDMRNKTVAGFTATAQAAKVATVATTQYTTAIVAANAAAKMSPVAGKIPLTPNIKNSLVESTHMMRAAAAYGVPEKVYRDSINQQKSFLAKMDKSEREYYKKRGARIEAAANHYADVKSREIKETDRAYGRAIAMDNKRTAIAQANVAKIAAANKFSIDSVTSSLNNMSQKFRTFGYLATATITAPIVMAGKAALNMAKDYEFSMQKIVGLTGVAQSTVNKWNDEILKMSPAVAQGPQKLADALYFISSSGIKGAEAMNVLNLSAKAASAGLGETQTVADLLTSALNAYKGTGLTAAYATDVLVAAVREGKAEATGFASAMGQIIPIASQLGVSFDQVAGGMAAITLTGSSSSQAAVYLKGIFNSLLKATTQGEAALEKTGNSYAGLRKILGEQGIIPLMQRLRDIQVKYGDELLSDVLPNIRALTGYLSLAGKNFKYNTEVMNRITNASGSLAKAFAAVSDTIKFKYDAAIAAAQVSLISLGKSIAISFLPLLDSLVHKLEGITTWFNTLSDAQKANRLKWVAFIALLGPASLLISVIGYALSGLLTIFKTLGTVISVVNVGLDAMGFKMLKLGALKFGNLKGGILSILGFLGESGAAATIGGVGIAVGGAAIALNNYAKKVKETAKAHDLYYTTLVNVNGELKKLKDLTGADVEAMTQSQVAVSMDQVRKAWIAAEAGWKQAEKNKSMPMINQGANLKQQAEYARQIAEYSKLYNEMTNAYLLGNMDKFKKIAKVLVDNSALIKIQAESTERLAQAWLDAHASAQKYTAMEMNNFIGGKPTFPKAGLKSLGSPISKPDVSEALGPDKVIQDMNKELAKQAVLGSLLNDTYDSLTSQIDVYRNAISAVYDLGWSEGNPMYDAMIEKLKELIGQQEKVAFSAKRMSNILSNSVIDMAMAIGAAFVNTQGAALAMVGIILQTGQQIVQMLLAEAIAATIAKNAMIPFGLIAAAAVGIGVLMALYSSAQAKASSASKMAKGGIIPAGYPNDTYPALLSSGEKVIPPGKLGNLERQSGLSELLKDVTFHIEGTQLVGVFKNQNRKVNSYS